MLQAILNDKMAHAKLVLFVVLYVLIGKVSLHYEFNTDYRLNNGGLDCDILLLNFAKSASNFTLCSLQFSRPIRVCEMCFYEYHDFTDRYNDITMTTVNGTSCKDTLLNVDRLEIIETYHQNLIQIWNRGYCDKCLNLSASISKPSISNETRLFFDYHLKTETCINNHKIKNDTNEATCKGCMKDYLTLNSFYESLKGSSDTMEICIDVVDSMNATRSTWSSVLNCCKLRQTPEVIFLLCTAFISIVPILFYVLARYFSRGARTKVMEQNRLCETFLPHNQEQALQSE